MHEEATSMSVPSSVAASTTQNENGTTPTVSVVTAEVEINVSVDNDNVDLQVPFSSNSGGNCNATPNYCHFMIHRLFVFRLFRYCLCIHVYHKPVSVTI